jgi:NTP pyrophosphatase (non-canonical NTP hydrolase)
MLVDAWRITSAPCPFTRLLPQIRPGGRTCKVKELAARLRDFADRREWQQYHTPKNLVMALSAEVGELTEHFQWLTPEEARNVMTVADRASEIEDELADVFIYLVRLADELNVDLLAAAHAKIDRNELRFPPKRQDPDS